MKKSDIDYFCRGETENLKFWNRLGGMPNLQGKICCDIGCGHGSLAIDMARNGGTKVFGFDLDKERIEFAKENLQKNFPQFEKIVEFHCADFKNFNMKFDIIASKDACEHIIYLKEMVMSIKEKLNEGGLFFVGFAPLYNSPYGDHKLDRIIPWGHLISPCTKEEIHNKGLNGLSLVEYEQIFYNSGLEVLQFKVNESKNIILNLFSVISRINFLREYFSHNIYGIFKK